MISGPLGTLAGASLGQIGAGNQQPQTDKVTTALGSLAVIIRELESRMEKLANDLVGPLTVGGVSGSPKQLPGGGLIGDAIDRAGRMERAIQRIHGLVSSIEGGLR